MTANEPNSYATAPPASAAASMGTSAGGKFDVNDIVMHFGREYYTTLSCSPERLHCFYGKQSSLLHCQEEDTEAAVCVGLEEIHDRIISMGYNGTRVVIGNIDCQPSMNGGILIFVLGVMHWPGGMARKFAQTFLLAEQPNGYFVLNDVLRILSNPTPPIASTTVPVSEAKSAVPRTTPINDPIGRQTMVQKEESSVSTVALAEPTVVHEKHPVERIPSTNVVTTATSPTPIGATSQQQHHQSQPAGDRKKKTAATATSTTTVPETPNKKTANEAEAQIKSANLTPSSWASLAAGQQSRWQSGTLAESKGPVASIPVEMGKENEGHQGTGRVSYRTNANNSITGGDRDRRPYQRSQEKNNERQQPRSENGLHRQYRAEYDASKSIYVSQIAGEIKRDALRKLFEQQFGEVKHFEVVPTKGMAFIEFNTEAARKAALTAKQVLFNDIPVKIEPRRAPREFNNGSGRHSAGRAPQQQAAHE